MKGYITTVLLTLLIWYIAMGFMMGEFIASNWSLGARITYICVSPYICLFACMIYNTIKEES